MPAPQVKRDVGDTTIQRITRLTQEQPFLASLRGRLIILVLLAVLPALALVIYNAFEERDRGREEAREDALRVARMAARNHDQLLESTRQLLATLAQVKEVIHQDGEACRAIFTNVLGLHPVYANIGAIRMDGHVFASALTTTNSVDLSDRSYFQEATNRGGFALGIYQIGRITRKATLNAGYPVRGTNGELNGVVYAALDLDWLQAVVTNANLPAGSSMTVIDRDRVTLVRYPEAEKYVGQRLAPSKRRRNPSEPRRPEGAAAAQSRDGTWRLYAYTPLGGQIEREPPWITVGIPLSAAYAAANQALWRNVAGLAIVSALALAAAWYGGNFIFLRRIKALLVATDRLRRGDLKARTQIPHGRNELHQLAGAFDEMAATLEQRVIERQRAEAELKALNEDLERRVAERTAELKRSNEELEQFASIASHDLQEPLRMVTNYLQLLQQRYQDKLDTKGTEFIAFSVDGAGRMQRLIHDLLSYARVGIKADPFQAVDCSKAVNEALANLSVAISESGAEVVSGPLPAVWGDPVLLTQLFQNLVSNAIKFRSDQPPRVQISASRRDGKWVFSVRDNGMGIAPGNFDRVFIIFQRLHARGKYQGSGIGLAVCKKIVERHGGRIWVESEPGRGTTFYFNLPEAEGLAEGTRVASD